MTATTWVAQWQQTTDAEFRAWGSAISTALAAVGLVQTSDTGQINWTTVLKPAGASAVQGYEIWRMNDTSQSTCPIYFKVEYGSGGTAAAPIVWITMGTGSSGAGTITGIFLTRISLVNAGTSEALNKTGYACAQDGFFWIALPGCTSGTTMGGGFGFSRFCDASGVPNTDGGVGWYSPHTSDTGVASVWHRPSSTIRTSSKLFPMPTWNTATSHAYAGNVAVYEPVVWSDRPCRVLGILGCMKADFAPGTSVSITAWGSSKTFMPLTGGVGPGRLDYAGFNGTGMLGVYS